MHTSITQGETLRALFSAHPILRARELRAAGVAPETIARAVESGDIDRIARGLYQLHDPPIDNPQGLADIAKRHPNGVIPLLPEPPFHGSPPPRPPPHRGTTSPTD